MPSKSQKVSNSQAIVEYAQIADSLSADSVAFKQEQLLIPGLLLVRTVCTYESDEGIVRLNLKEKEIYCGSCSPAARDGSCKVGFISLKNLDYFKST